VTLGTRVVRIFADDTALKGSRFAAGERMYCSCKLCPVFVFGVWVDARARRGVSTFAKILDLGSLFSARTAMNECACWGSWGQLSIGRGRNDLPPFLVALISNLFAVLFYL
jgi:hypothetical protein